MVTVTDASGAVVKTIELTPENCSAELTLDKVGEYMVTAVVEGQYGMKSPAGCEIAVKVAGARSDRRSRSPARSRPRNTAPSSRWLSWSKAAPDC